MRLVLLATACLATACLADDVLKNAGVRLGLVTNLDCTADGGLTCSRTLSTGTGNLRCSLASSTEQGCVSTVAQAFSGTKTFAGVRASSYGGADGGVYAKLSNGASLTPVGFVTAYSPSLDSTRDPTRFVAWFALGGLVSPIQVRGLFGLPVERGANDGGLQPDGGNQAYLVTLTGIDDAGTRTVCSAAAECDFNTGTFFHMVNDTSCGLDGGGRVNSGGTLVISIDDTQCLVAPGLNLEVDYTGLP